MPPAMVSPVTVDPHRVPMRTMAAIFASGWWRTIAQYPVVISPVVIASITMAIAVAGYTIRI
jgi:hypothetical protein